MDANKNILSLTILLSAVAGFCDTITFVTADEIFSAHVTGNFIVFAYDLVVHPQQAGWIRLMTLPVFAASVMAGGWIASHNGYKYRLLLIEALLLFATGGIALFATEAIDTEISAFKYALIMIVVIAMGLQNAFGKLFGKETFGPTTMMTGNVTQASLDFGNAISSQFKDIASLTSLKHQMVILLGFLAGCLLGAGCGKTFGLSALVIPGIALLLSVWIRLRNTEQRS